VPDEAVAIGFVAWWDRRGRKGDLLCRRGVLSTESRMERAVL
jgi:hypothetical protein